MKRSSPIFGTVLTCLAMASTPAQAQRAALVQDIDDNIRIPYQEARNTSCSFPGNCAMVNFSTVPPGRRRLIEHISCLAFVGAGGSLQTFSLNSTAFRLPRGFFPISVSPASAQTFITNSPTLLYFEAGETPRLDSFSQGAPVQDLLCTLTGRETAVP